MASVGMNVDIDALVDATRAGSAAGILESANELIDKGAGASELIGRVGVIAAHGDSDGHTILMLAAASMMSRWQLAWQRLVGEDSQNHRRELPLLAQSLVAAAPAVQAGYAAYNDFTPPKPFFPSDLKEGEQPGDRLRAAVVENDVEMVERMLLGLYGTGADYRTTNIRMYDALSTSFQNNGHPLMFAVRSFQLLDAVEWSLRVPHILHWLAPRVTVRDEEPTWVKTVQDFLAEPGHSLASYRTRLAAPRDEHALPLRRLLLSDTDGQQICQAVYDALIPQGASAAGIASVIALTATDLLQRVGDENREAFLSAAHSLLFTAATRLTYSQVQEVEALPLLFTSACYLHSLHNELAASTATQATSTTQARTPALGGGLFAPAILETLDEQLSAQDLAGAFATARRYIQLGYDTRALFATIALAAARVDAAADRGHTLQIVQAAGEEFMAWPRSLRETSAEGFVHTALRAVAFGPRNNEI